MEDQARDDYRRILRVAAVQVESENGRVMANLARANPLVEQASEAGAQLILLPEFMPTGYLLAKGIWDVAERSEGPTVTWLKHTSKSLGIWLGTSFLEAENKDFYNTFVLTNPEGEVAGRVRKQFPAIWEAYFFKGESGSHAIDTPLGKVGVGICFDNHTAAVATTLSTQSVDLLLMPHSYPTPTKPSGMFKSMNERLAEIPLFYASLFGIPVVLANKCGPWESPVPSMRFMKPAESHFPGLSSIIDSDASIKARLGEEQGVIVADVTVDPARKKHATPPHYGRHVLPGPPQRAVLRLIEGIGRLRYGFSSTRKNKARQISQ